MASSMTVAQVMQQLESWGNDSMRRRAIRKRRAARLTALDFGHEIADEAGRKVDPPRITRLGEIGTRAIGQNLTKMTIGARYPECLRSRQIIRSFLSRSKRHGRVDGRGVSEVVERSLGDRLLVMAPIERSWSLQDRPIGAEDVSA